MLLFSIPVHEKPEVVLNQIENFKYFNPNCIVVLHVSLGMSVADYNRLEALLEDLDFVYINPTRLQTGWADGTLFKAHLETMRFAIREGIAFSHFCLHASNEMFVKTGLEDWVNGYDAGFDQVNEGKNNPVYQQIDHFKKDIFSSRILRRNGLERVLGSQVEGTFYSRELVELIIERLAGHSLGELGRFFSLGEMSSGILRSKVFRITEVVLRRLGFAKRITPFCKEEVYFPTLVGDLLGERMTRKMSYCFINWHTNLTIKENEIDWIRQNNIEALHESKNFRTTTHLGAFNYFTVKRVDRDISNPVRQYIMCLE